MTRILWIGCHKLLIQTELSALRELGYEVYRPTYLSDIYDQSAVLEPDSNPTTLPKNVIELLRTTNFFYEPISKEVAETINKYFDTCIVTISPNWLMHIVNSFTGKIIFRTYGQPYSLTAEFETLGITSKLLNHEDFLFIPHSLHSLELEHDWLKAKAIEVPYWINDDVYSMEDSWKLQDTNYTIGLLCPNIENPYYQNHYRYLNRNFKGRSFKVFGVQPKTYSDKRVVGTLHRNELLQQFKQLKAFLYTYTEKNTCYLPPIEASVIGVPILYPEKSLISKYLGKDGPGEWKNEKEALRLLRRIKSGDTDLINKIKFHQEPLKDLYRKSTCLSRFNTVLRTSIESSVKVEIKPKKTVVIPFYFPGNIVRFDGNSYSTAEGIPRVVKFFVETLLDNNFGVEVLTHERQVASSWGYFNHGRTNNFCKILSVSNSRSGHNLKDQIFRFIKKIVFTLPEFVSTKVRSLSSKWRKMLEPKTHLKTINAIFQDTAQKILLIPHYYHFHNLLKTNIDTTFVLYLPDYIPHLFPKEFRREIKLFEKKGRKVAEISSLIITNSNFTAGYLPKSNLKVNPEKIRVFNLPRLGISYGSIEIKSLINKKFLFYPTQFRANKRIDLLLQVFDKIASEHNIYLVLTGNLEDNQNAKEAYSKMAMSEMVRFVGSISDDQMNWLYKKCQAVVVSSESEGNFPPQIVEAIYFERPFVAPSIRVVTEVLGPNTNAILFQANSASSLESQIRRVLLDAEAEEEKVRSLKSFMMKDLDSKAKAGLLSVVSEAFALTNNKIGE